MRGAPGQDVVGDSAPLETGRDQTEERIKRLSHIHGAGAASRLRRGNARIDDLPLGVRQTAGAPLVFHTRIIPTIPPFNTGSQYSTSPYNL